MKTYRNAITKNIRIVIIILLSVLLFIGIPILLNYIISRQNPLHWQNVMGTPQDWLTFWGAYLGSVGTIIMAIIAFMTLKQNDQQLKELKRQWEEEHSPLLSLSIIGYRKALFIKINNIGKSNATDIKLSFNKDFVGNLLKDDYKSMYERFENLPFDIESGGAKYIVIGFYQDLHDKWSNKNIVLRITGTYHNKSIDETFLMEEYVNPRFAGVKDPLWEIADSLSCPNSDNKPIQESLAKIAKSLTNQE